MADKKTSMETTPLDAEWWREFADGFFSEGVDAAEDVGDSVNDAAEKIESMVKDGREKIQAFLNSGRDDVEQALRSSLEQIHERLDRIERRLDENGSS
ncbi:MAG: hypothetical protein MK085_04835 [Phycisphaerales bacterium]|nr:hypothetical protein [Phycisphaerales bacterium]